MFDVEYYKLSVILQTPEKQINTDLWSLSRIGTKKQLFVKGEKHQKNISSGHAVVMDQIYEHTL